MGGFFLNRLTMLWDSRRSFSQFLFFEKCCFCVLCVVEFFYCIGFRLVHSVKRFTRSSRDAFPFKIISVGNLSVGGTGKSVVVAFLVKQLADKHCAIVLRGYKGSVQRQKKSILVSDGQQVFADRFVCGDEAVMHAQTLRVPVVVGRNRALSCDLLKELSLQGSPIKYVILDDAYQNSDVVKDVEIVLLDARAPLENGHCLPAGRLREKDLSRAHILILTHADLVSYCQLSLAVQQITSAGFPGDAIFCGKHRADGVYHLNLDCCSCCDIEHKKFLIAAGIGSFDGFVATVREQGICVCASYQFADHHPYTSNDVHALFDDMNQQLCDGIVVTTKDWVKLQPLLIHRADFLSLPIYVLRVVFEFLSAEEYSNFQKALCNFLSRESNKS